MKKAAFILALAMLLGVAAGCGQSAGEASVQSVSMICGLGSAGMTDRFAGVVSALGETNIKKDDSMTIGEIKVKAGDAVNVGDVLFTYDMSQLEIDLEDAQLSLEELKSQLETQQEEKKQAEDALDETTDDTERRRLLLDIRGYNNEMQKTNRSIAEKNRDIEKLQKNMQNSSVKAEVAGEVKSVNANGSTDSNGNPLPLISIVQTGGYRVKATSTRTTHRCSARASASSSAPVSATRRGRAPSPASTGTTPPRAAATITTAAAAAAATPVTPANTRSMWSSAAAMGC